MAESMGSVFRTQQQTAVRSTRAAVAKLYGDEWPPLPVFDRTKGDAMKSQIFGLQVASAVFGLMALAQVARLVIQPEVIFAGHPVPLWPSVLAVVVLGGLSVWLCKLSALRVN